MLAGVAPASGAQAIATAPQPIAAPAHIAAAGLCVDVTLGRQTLRILDDVAFAVPRGGFASLIGPSGCGKSTLLKVLAGLLPPSAGRVTIGGEVPANAVRAGHVGLVFQEPTLLPWLDALQNAGMLLRVSNRKLSRHAVQERAAESLAIVGLSGSEQRMPAQLSGGMRQRVGIARALALDPDLLLMDEPFGALDAITRESMSAFLLQLWERTAKTVVLVTHSIDEAIFLSSQVHVMAARPGRILADLPVRLPYPRDDASYAAPEFGHLAVMLRALLRQGSA